MRKVFSSFLVLLLLLSSIPFINTAMADELPSISIKLKNYIGNQNQVNITIKGEYDITGSNFLLVEGKTYTVKVENSVLSLYENGTLLSKFTSFTAVPKEYGTNNYISINNRPYLGTMKFDLENNTYFAPQTLFY